MAKRAGDTSKSFPYEKYEIDAIEGWLDEQARQGLRLTLVQGRRCWFEKPETPAMTRYRIDVRGKHTDEQERLDTYAQLGWQFVAAIDSRMSVYRADRPDAVEINTDEEALQEMLGRYYRWELFSALFYLAMGLFFVHAFWRWSAKAGGFFTAALGPLGRDIPIGLLFVLYSLFCCVFHLVTLRRARVRTQTERGYHSPALAKRRLVVVWGISLALIVFYLCILLGNYIFLGVREGVPLPDARYPVPALEELAPEYAGTKTTLLESGYLFSRGCSVSEAVSAGQYPEDSPALPLYQVRLYDAKWAFLAQGAAREHVAGRNAQVVTVPGWSGAWYYETAGDGRTWQHLVLLEGNRVLLADYSGAGELTDHLALFGQ